MPPPVPHRIRPARASDAGELFTLQRAAYVGEAQRTNDTRLAPLRETLTELQAVIADPDRLILTAVGTEDGEWGHRGRLIGAARLTFTGDAVNLARIVVAPDLTGRGIGSTLLQAAHEEAARRDGVSRLELLAGAAGSDNLALYRRFGYIEVGTDHDDRGGRMSILSRPV